MTEPEPPPDEESPPADTFALVGHEIRAGLIQVLGPTELSPSELRSRLEADVEPSQLHYHLQQLVGHFIEQTDDGYRLNSVGHRLSWTLRAGALDRREDHMTVAADFECYYCGAPVEASFEKGHAEMGCPECDHVYMTDYYGSPLDAFADEAVAFSHFSKYMVFRILSLSRGVCPSCASSITSEFQSLDDDHTLKAEIVHSCDSCDAMWWQTVGMALLADPDLIAFCYDHGIDILSTPHWELEFAATDKHVTVRSTDPWEVGLEVTFDGDTLELVIDGDLNVVERNRLSTDDDRASRGDADLPDDAVCLQVLRHQRWPDEVMCPHCDSTDIIKKGMSKKDAQRYRCHTCNSFFNDLTGTIFAERQLSLPEMFYIMMEMNAMTTSQIARQLDRSYDSVSDFTNEVQEARGQDTEFDFSGTGNTDDLSWTF